MPKRTDLESILIIGAGPIIIGQACEFDYSGTQACKALREEGYKVILVNSNPATIMTDPEFADVELGDHPLIEGTEGGWIQRHGFAESVLAARAGDMSPAALPLAPP